MKSRRFTARCLIVRYQSPEPGFGEKYWSLSALPSHSFQSGGGAFLTLIFGQIFAYSALGGSHFSSPASLSALMASTGHSGWLTPESMHSLGLMMSMFSPSLKQSTWLMLTKFIVLQRMPLTLIIKVNSALQTP